jgi:hypothetical protein
MSFLDILPREIRNDIFEYVFTSKNGTIQFVPINSDPPIRHRIEAFSHLFNQRGQVIGRTRISLAILRTCKQIYDECKDLLWKYNDLLIDDAYPAFDLPGFVKSRVQSVQLNVDLLNPAKRRGCLPLKEDFIHLRTWPSLKRLELNCNCEVIHDREGAVMPTDDPLRRLVVTRLRGEPSQAPDAGANETVYHEYLSVLRAAGGEGGYFCHLERGIYFETSFYSSFKNPSGVPERFFPAMEGDPMEMLAELACAFGGSLAVNAEVCIRDKAQVSRIFTKWGNTGWHYRDDSYRWAMAKLWAQCFGGDVWDRIMDVPSRFELYTLDKVLEVADMPQFRKPEYRDKAQMFKKIVGRLGGPGVAFR